MSKIIKPRTPTKKPYEVSNNNDSNNNDSKNNNNNDDYARFDDLSNNNNDNKDNNHYACVDDVVLNQNSNNNSNPNSNNNSPYVQWWHECFQDASDVDIGVFYDFFVVFFKPKLNLPEKFDLHALLLLTVGVPQVHWKGSKIRFAVFSRFFNSFGSDIVNAFQTFINNFYQGSTLCNWNYNYRPNQCKDDMLESHSLALRYADIKDENKREYLIYTILIRMSNNNKSKFRTWVLNGKFYYILQQDLISEIGVGNSENMAKVNWMTLKNKKGPFTNIHKVISDYEMINNQKRKLVHNDDGYMRGVECILNKKFEKSTTDYLYDEDPESYIKSNY